MYYVSIPNILAVKKWWAIPKRAGWVVISKGAANEMAVMVV